MTFLYYLNVYNFQKILLAARKADAIALLLYAYFRRKDFPIFTDVKTWSYYQGETQLNFVGYLYLTLFYLYVTITGQSLGIYIFYNRHIQRDMQMQQLEKVHFYVTVLTLLMEQLLVFVDMFKRVLYSSHTRVHGVKFQSAVLPNGFIINPEEQQENQRHHCILCFMNLVY